jgi:hypothetical protein
MARLDPCIRYGIIEDKFREYIAKHLNTEKYNEALALHTRASIQFTRCTLSDPESIASILDVPSPEAGEL